MDEEVVLNVKLDAQKVAENLAKTTEQINTLKQEQKLLNEALKSGQISEENYGKAMSQSNSELEKATRATKGYIAQLKVLDKDTGQYGDSLNEQRRKLNDMQKAYDELDANIRNSKAGKEFLKQIQQQDKAVKEMENSTGRFGRSVGSYEDALKKAGVGVDGFTQKMKALMANPWAILIGAIVVVFKKLIDAFKGSEDRMNEMRKAFAPLKAVGDMIKQTFDKLAASLGGLVSGALKKVTEGVKWLFSALDRLAKKVGLDWNLSGAFEAIAENSKNATEAEIKYAQHRRQWIEQEAKYEKQVAELRDKSVQKDKYNTDERIKFLEDAIAIERKMADEKVKLAKENLAYLQAEAARSENDAEMNDKLAEAKAAVTRAETDYYNTTKNLNAQIVAFRKEEQSEAKRADAEAEKNLKEDQKRTKASLDYRREVQLKALGQDTEYTQKAYDINMLYFKDLLDLYEKDSADYYNALKAREQYDETYAEKRKEMQEKVQEFMAQYNSVEKLENEYEQELNALEEFYSQGLISTEEYESTKTKIQDKYSKERTKATMAEVGALAGAFDAMANMLGEYAAENEQAAKAQKAFSLMSILLNQAQSISQGALAISEGVASAAMIPFPANIPAILSVVATISGLIAGVGTSIAQAKQLFSQADTQKFATGGIVGGTSYTGDQVPVMANSREMYLTLGQQKELFDIANGNGAHGINYELLAASVAALPAPVMEYTEFKQFEQNVSTYNEIAAV